MLIDKNSRNSFIVRNTIKEKYFDSRIKNLAREHRNNLLDQATVKSTNSIM